jgi:NitT/TauT family transport system substrate-binding protein
MKYVRLNLDFYHPWANNAGYYVARAHNHYKREGIELDITSYDPYRQDSLHRLLRGEIEIACNYPQRLMLHTEQGADPISIAAVNSTTFESLVFDDRRPIHTVKDLEHKKIGTPHSPRVRQVLRYLMEHAGADPASLQFVEYYPAEPDPLLIEKGEIDAIWGTYWSWEGVLARLKNHHISWFKAPELGAPYIHNSILAVRKKTTEEEGDLLRGFLKATKQGFKEAAENPGEAAEIMVMVAPTFTTKEFKAAIEACAPTWNIDQWGRHNPALITEYAQWLASQNILTNGEGHHRSFTQEFLPS